MNKQYNHNYNLIIWWYRGCTIN